MNKVLEAGSGWLGEANFREGQLEIIFLRDVFLKAILKFS